MASNDDALSQVQNFTGLNEEDCKILLEANNNDPEKAVMEFFDDPEALQKHREKKIKDRSWNGNFFENDSYQIHGTDVNPTRPNSRTTNRSPNNGAIDQVDDAATDMDNAIRNSLITAGIGQESGIVESGAQFGPANRNEYNASQWAMVPLGGSTTHEIFLDPSPLDRRRMDGAPAFLKPSSDDGRLGALLTIYHQIPLLREILLRREHSSFDIGHDPEWWMGKKIETPRLVVETDSEGDIEGVMQNHHLTEELQRLTAFLDKTDRAYGSVENVIGLLVDKSRDVVTCFFDEWRLNLDDTARNKITSVAVQPTPNGPEVEEFSFLQVSESAVLDSNNLYDCLDSTLWNRDSGLEVEDSAFLRQVGEVITIKLKGKTPTKHIDIPINWYADRYLESNCEAALSMRRQKQDIRHKITKINGLKEKLTNFTKNGKTFSIRDLLNSSLNHDKEGSPEAPMSTETDTMMEREQSEKQAALDLLSDQLRRTMASIDEKLESLEKEKEKAQASLQELSEFHTKYTTGMHSYTLRGISSSPNTIYVKQGEVSGNDSDTWDSNWQGQWWKISFSAGEQPPISIHTVFEDTVAEAARESHEPILVYASEQAMQQSLTPLSDQLSRFVEMDNLAFSNELPEPTETTNWAGEALDTHSPGKRKYNEDGEEAQDTWRDSPRRESMDVNLEEGEVRWGDQTPPHTPPHVQEMEERKSLVERSKGALAFLGSSATSSVSAVKGNDMMDVDQVMPDADVTEESAAVREVGGGFTK